MQPAPPLALLAGVASLAPAAAAQAAAAGPDITVAVRETADTWRNTAGGLSRGWTTLNKLQVSATWTANALDDPGFRVHAQVFRANDQRLTSRTGDLQTVSNIEALGATRLFEAWAEQSFGSAAKGGVAVRVGLIDLNSDFDSIDPASLFIDSSHGIGPDISKSGRNGPSIFPVSAFAARLTWTPDEAWTVRGGVFDGVAGDPGRPKAFAAVRLSATDGTLAIVQIDRKLGKDSQVSAGAWRYDGGVPAIDGSGPRAAGGVYGFVEGPVPGAKDWTGWVRLGWADPAAQEVGGYLGAGLVRKGAIPGRPDDRLGVAVSSAILSPQARRLLGLRRAETTVELTYQFKARQWLALQPDVQYVIHPSSQAGLADATVVGLRMVFTAGYPRGAPANESIDPTLSPDNPPDAPPAASPPGR